MERVADASYIHKQQLPSKTIKTREFAYTLDHTKKLIFLYLTTWWYRYYTLNTMYIVDDIHKKLILTKINNYTVQYKLLHNNKNTNIPYNWPSFLASSQLNSGYTASYALIRMLLRVTCKVCNIVFYLKQLYSLDLGPVCIWFKNVTYEF